MSVAMNAIREIRFGTTGRGGTRLPMLGAGAIAVVLAVAAGVSQTPTSSAPSAGYHPEKDTAVTAVNARPDANRMMQLRRTHLQMQQFAAANLERKRQLSADSERLLQLASELSMGFEKAREVDLSLTAKADMIEKLAHAVEEKMKLTVAAQ